MFSDAVFIASTHENKCVESASTVNDPVSLRPWSEDEPIQGGAQARSGGIVLREGLDNFNLRKKTSGIRVSSSSTMRYPF
jgi:hypothetical protein